MYRADSTIRNMYSSHEQIGEASEHSLLAAFDHTDSHQNGDMCVDRYMSFNYDYNWR